MLLLVGGSAIGLHQATNQGRGNSPNAKNKQGVDHVCQHRTIPANKPGCDVEFRQWFAWSNEEFAKQKGFIRRQLLKPRQIGNYAAIVEHESVATFQAMHSSPIQAEASKRVQPFFDGEPKPEFYEVVTG